MSALQMSRDLDVQYKTAFVLMHKMRESLGEPPQQLEGEVEMDGAYFNGHVRPHNERKDRIDRRLKENQDPDKRVILVARQRGPEGTGAVETVAAVAKSENEDAALAFAKKHVVKSATITTDEHVSYNALHGQYKVERVNHQINYVGPVVNRLIRLNRFSHACVVCISVRLTSLAITIWIGMRGKRRTGKILAAGERCDLSRHYGPVRD